MNELKVLELFSGIAGMHYALNESGVGGKVIAAIDINESANKTYKLNFPNSKCLNKNIDGLQVKDYQDINTIFMSPPCLPFTRNGKFLDLNDNR
jgi:tRNA (cytosine38-C5)-methyltransferase